MTSPSELDDMLTWHGEPALADTAPRQLLAQGWRCCMCHKEFHYKRLVPAPLCECGGAIYEALKPTVQ